VEVKEVEVKEVEAVLLGFAEFQKQTDEIKFLEL